MAKSYSSIKAGWTNTNSVSNGTKKEKRYEDIHSADYDFGVDNSYVNSYFKDLQSFLDDPSADYEERMFDLNRRKSRIQGYINSRKNYLGEESVNEFNAILSDAQKTTRQAVEKGKYLQSQQDLKESTAQTRLYNAALKDRLANGLKVDDVLQGYTDASVAKGKAKDYISRYERENPEFSQSNYEKYLRMLENKERTDNMSLDELKENAKTQNDINAMPEVYKAQINERLAMGLPVDDVIRKRDDAKKAVEDNVLYYDENGDAVTYDRLVRVKTAENTWNNLSSDTEALKVFERLQNEENELANLRSTNDLQTLELDPQFQNLNSSIVSDRQALASMGYDFDEIEYYQKWKADKEGYQDSIKDAQEFGGSGVGGALGSALFNIASSPLQIGETIQNLGYSVRGLLGGDDSVYGLANIYDDRVRNTASTMLSSATQMINDYVYDKSGSKLAAWLASGAYSGVVSSLQSAFNVAVCQLLFGGAGVNISLALMGSQAANSQFAESIKAGSTNGKALATAIGAGVNEALFERLSVENLQGIKDLIEAQRWDYAGWSNFFKSIIQNSPSMLTQGLVEGSEEFFTDIANAIWDSYVNGDNSDYQRKVKEYMDQGYESGVAGKLATKDFFADLASSFYGGFIGGLGTGQMQIARGTIGLANEYTRNARQIGQAINERNNLSELASQVQDINDSSLNARLENINNTEKKEGRAYNRQVGRLAQEVYAKNYAQMLQGNKNAFSEEVRESLKDRNDISDMNTAVSAITKDAYGDFLTSKERRVYAQIGGREIVDSMLKDEDLMQRVRERTEQAKYQERMRNVERLTQVNVKETESEEGSKSFKAIKDAEEKAKLEAEDEQTAKEMTAKEYMKSMNYLQSTQNAILADIREAKENISDVSTYILGLNEAINYGKIGYAQQYIKDTGYYGQLTKAQQNFGYNLGLQAAVEQLQIDQAKRDKKLGKLAKSTGTIHYMKSVTDGSIRNAKQKSGIEALAWITTNITHNNVYFYQSFRDSEGNFHVGEDMYGIDKFDKDHTEAPNGFYRTKNGDVYIDINAGNKGEGVILMTASHELTHYIKEWSPAKFNTLAQFLTDQYAKSGKDINDFVNKQIQKAAEDGRDLSYDEAYEEAVADSMELMLTDEHVYEKILELKQKDRTLAQKIFDGIKRIVADIKKAYGNIDPNSQTAESRYFKKYFKNHIDKLQELQDLWAEALVDAGETFGSVSGVEGGSVVDNADSGTKLSGREIGEQLEMNFDLTGDLAMQSAQAISDLESIKASKTTMKDRTRTLAVRFREDLINKGNVNLIGQIAKSADDLAVVAQVLRDPRFETARYIFTDKNGKIVLHSAITSGITDASSVVPKNGTTYLAKMAANAKKLGAENVYLLHNHPSGDPTPSSDDYRVLNQIARAMSHYGFKNTNGVIIDSNKYATFNYNGESDIKALDMGEDKLLAGEGDKNLLNTRINSSDALSLMAKKIQLSRDYSALIFLGAKLDVQAVQELHNSVVADELELTEYIESNLSNYGATRVALVTDNNDSYANAKKVYDMGLALDVIQKNGDFISKAASSESRSLMGGRMYGFGEETVKFSTRDSEGKQLTKAQQEYFKDSKIRDEDGNLKVMFHGTRRGGFTVFDSKYSDDNLSLFFTDDEEVAKTYTDGRSARRYSNGAVGNVVYPVYLNITNPLVVDAGGQAWFNIQNGELENYQVDRRRLGDFIFARESDYDSFNNKYDLENLYELLNKVQSGESVEYKGETYDDESDIWNLIQDAELKAEKEYREYFNNNAKFITAKEFFEHPENYGWYDLESLRNTYDVNGISLEELRDYNDNNFEAAIDMVRNDFDEQIEEGNLDSNFYDTFEFKAMPQTGDEGTRRDLHETRWYSKKAKAEGCDGVIINNVYDRIYGEGTSTVVVAFDSNQIKSVDNKKPTSNADIRYSNRDSEGRELSEGQQNYFRDSKVRDDEGNLLRVYHGTGRADRVGTVFRPDRATSGPMAFFTTSKEIADNYARDKKDTSLAYDERYDSYYTQFRVNKNGKDISVPELWKSLSTAEKNRIREAGKHITFDDDYENIIYDKDAEYGLGNWDDYLLNSHKGNALEALVEAWLEDGELYGDEGRFIEVLKLAGINDVEYLDPSYRDEKTYDTYLNITKPFDVVNEVDDTFIEDYLKWVGKQKKGKYDNASANADMWDKNNITSDMFAERMSRDIANGTSHAWTSIPDSMSDYLKSLDYDGIKDLGGKNGGDTHTVWIPFYSNQIKNIDNLNPTENADIRYSFRSTKSGMANDMLHPYQTEMKELIEKKGNVIVDTYDKLVEQVDRIYADPNYKTTLYFGNVDVSTLKRIQSMIPNIPKALNGEVFKTGSTYSIVATTDSIRHIPDEKKGITKADVLDYLDRFADTIINPDSVNFSYYTESGQHQNGLRFKKSYPDGIYMSFDLISNKKKTIGLQSLFMDSANYIKKKSAAALMLNKSATSTSKTQGSQTSNDNLPQSNEKVKQDISSADTSLDQIPALFTDKRVEFGETNVDVGGGRFDRATQYLAEQGTTNYIFDPFNRTNSENRRALDVVMNGGADTATCANVLNVIAEEEARANVILEMAKSIKPDGTAYFMVYEGDGSGVGKETSKGYQNNRKTADYVDEISKYFDNVERHGKLIIATNPKANLPKAAWQLENSDNPEVVMYSNRDPEVIKQLQKVNEHLERENAKLQEDYDDLKELLRIQGTVTGGRLIKKTSAEAMARRLMKSLDLKGNTSEFANLIYDAYSYIQGEDNPLWDVVEEKIGKAVEWANENKVEQKIDLSPEARQILRVIRESKVSLSDAMKSNAAHRYGSYNDYRKSMLGNITISDNASQSLDQLWQELSSMRPDVFDADISEADMPIALADAIASIRNEGSDDFFYGQSMMSDQDMFNEIYNGFWDVATLYTVADKKQSEINALKRTHQERMSTLRKEKNAKIDEIRKEERDRREALRTAYRQRLEKQRTKMMENYQKGRDKAREKRTSAELRHRINQKISELNKLLLHPDKKHHIPKDMQSSVAKALDLIDFENPKRQGLGTRQKLQYLKDMYATFKKASDKSMQYVWDQTISDMIDAVSEDIGDTPFHKMSSVQLEPVYQMYSAVLAMVRNANKTFAWAKQQDVIELAEDVIKEVRTVGGSKEMEANWTRTIKDLYWNDMKPVYAMKAIGSKTLQKLFDNVRKGEDTYALDVSDAKAYFQDQAKLYGYKTWDLDTRYEFESGDGKKFTLNLMEMLSLWEYNKRPQADAHLSQGGFVFENNEIKKKNKLGLNVKYTLNTADTYRVTPKVMQEISRKLTDNQKAFADAMQQYLAKIMGEKGNEVTRQMYDIDLYTDEHYFPLKSSKVYLHQQSTEVKGESKIKNAGFSNAVVPNANNPIVLQGLTDVWTQHVNDMSMYHAFVLPLEDFQRVFGYRTSFVSEDAVSGVKAAIQNAYGDKANSYINQMLIDLNGGARTDSRTGLMNKMIGLFKKGAVFASASVVIQQPSAIARAWAYIDPKYFVQTIGKTVNLKEHSKQWEEAKRFAPVAIIKQMGYFDTGLGKSTQDWMIESQPEGFSEIAKALVMDSDYRDDVLSKAPELADEITWTHIWNAAKAQVLDQNKGLKEGSEEHLEKAGQLFTETIVNTQVYDSVLSRSGLMRSKDSGVKMATSFMAEPTTSINMMADALLEAKRTGNKSVAAKKIGSVFAQIILNSILVSLVYAARDDDDKTYAEKYIGQLVSNTLDSANPLNMIPFTRDIVSIVQGYDVERADMSIISDLVKAYQKLIKSTDSTGKKVIDFAGTVSKLFGLPVTNITRDVRGILNIVNGMMSDNTTSWEGIRNSIAEEVTGTQVSTQYKNRLNKAIKQGDTAKIRSAVDNWVNQKMKSGKTEKEAKSSIQSSLTSYYKPLFLKAYQKGDDQEMARIRKALAATGIYKDVVETTQNWIKSLK